MAAFAFASCTGDCPAAAIRASLSSGVFCSCYANCRAGRCNMNLAAQDGASRYQRLRLIQNTVRVPESLYANDKAALAVYQPPLSAFQNVNWNQMSDRAAPHVQTVVTASGSQYHGSSLRRSLVRPRPGAMSPGGVGVDIKHNSYARYLLRLKGGGPCQSQTIPPTFGKVPIVFNPAVPIYGGKTVKTSIAGSGWGAPSNPCNCP